MITTVVCLAVIGIVGTFCVEGAQPIGQCQPRIAEVLECSVDAQSLPIRASWYNPQLGGINCDSDCSTTGDGTPVEQCYDVCIACPIGWYGKWIEFEPWIGQWQCRDAGGAVHPTYSRIYTQHGFQQVWYIIVDFMTYTQPEWAYMLLEWK